MMRAFAGVISGWLPLEFRLLPNVQERHEARNCDAGHKQGSWPERARVARHYSEKHCVSWAFDYRKYITEMFIKW